MVQKNMPQQDKVLHIRFDYDEVIESKKDVLRTEESLIKLMQIVKNYKALREEELKRKIELYQALRKMRLELNKLQEGVPDLKPPKNITPKKEPIKEIKRYGVKQHDPLEKELREIQEKIRLLQQ